MKDIAKLALLCAMGAAMTGCESDSDTPFLVNPGEEELAVPYGYPTMADIFDQAGNTNAEVAGASSISVGQTYPLSIFPQGDQDFMKIQLTSGIEYEISVNKVCATCDVYTYLYDTDGTTQLASSDDYVYLDSRIVFTPSATGTYFVRVEAYNETTGVANYRLNVHAHADGDGDGYSSYYDCNDGDSDIYPGNAETPADGIDQDCSGTDTPDELVADRFEVDNSTTAAKNMPESPYGADESLFIFQALSGQDRTIHANDDEDWLRLDVPAFGAVDPDFVSIFGSSPTMEVFEADGLTPYVDSYVKNTTASTQTFYVRFTGAAGGIYVPYFDNIGVDADEDGFYSQDWGTSRDCNDGNAAIKPGAVEVPNNGIDENCNSSDDVI